MPKQDDAELLQLDGHTVRISNPAKPYFAGEAPGDANLSKLDIVRYFLSVSEGALSGISDRPIVLKRFVNGAHLAGTQPEPFYQKRAPADLPPFLRTVTLSFPSGRTADEIVIDNPAALAWIVNLGCIELHPHPVRTADLDHPDQLRVDLDPGPGVDFAQVRHVALEVDALLDELGLAALPKTSGSRGMHLNIPIHPRWTFTEVRRAALALARAVERRAPTLATSKWWKEERHGVFLDYNQNAKDRTTASAYSVRPLPDARVSAPLAWHEVPDCNPADFTVLTMPARFARLGDPHLHMALEPCSLDPLLELAARDESEGQGDAPWPPHFAKGEHEPARVAPSRAKSASGDTPRSKSFAAQSREGFGAHRFRKRSATLSEAPGPEPGAPSQTASPSEVGIRDLSVSPDDTIALENRHPERSAAESKDLHSGAPQTSEAGSDELAPTKPARKAPARRTPKFPLLTIANSPDKPAALAGLERWRAAHPAASSHLAEDDILIDRMRGAAYIWYRIRVNLRHVPDPDRPPQSTPDPDEDPTRAWREN